MSDLDKRLRTVSKGGIPDFTNSDLIDEAADRIESLESALNDLWEWLYWKPEYSEDNAFLNDHPKYRDLIESCKPDIRTVKK